MGTTTDRDTVTMICPNLGCGRTVCAPAATRGKTVRCPYCNSAFRVPGPRGNEPNGAPEVVSLPKRKG